MNKILFLIRRTPPNTGAIKMNEFYYNLINRNENYKTSVIKLNSYNSLSKMGKFNFSVICMFFKNYLNLFYKLIFDKPDLIYMEVAPSGFALIRDSLYLFLAKLFKVRILIQFHSKGLSKYIDKKYKFIYFKWVFKDIKVIILSTELFSEYSRVIDKKQIYYLPNGISDEVKLNFNLILQNRKRQKKLNILFLSNLFEFKGPIDVLYICKKLKEDNVDFICNFIGDFYSVDFKNKFIKIRKKYKLEKDCILRGSKQGFAKNKYFEMANVFIYPTKNDCFPLVVLESFMYGIPVLTYDVGALKNMVSNTNFGFVAKKNNYLSIYNYLKKNENDIINLKYAINIRNYFLKNYLSLNSEIDFKNIIKNELKK